MNEEMHLKISRSISKLGEDIPSVNLPAGETCRKDAPCFKKCYAHKGRFCFRRNQENLQNNLKIWKESPEKYEYEVGTAAYFTKFFRWHSSGDIPDFSYLEMMVRVAKLHPTTNFLAFTKKYELVNAYLDDHGTFPKNLTIVLSAWGKFFPENPHCLPVAYVRLKGEQVRVPDSARECESYCGECVKGGSSCWNLRRGESVVFNEH